MKLGFDFPDFRALAKLPARQWLYLPRLFTRREKLRLLALGLVAAASLSLFLARLVGRITVPVPAVGGTLREGVLAEPRFINPLYASNDADRDLVNLIFSKLITYDGNGNAVPDLAESVEISADGKAYTLTLRRGVRWHDGEDLSADDVVFTVKTVQDPEYKSPLRQNWQGVAAEKLDERTVRFLLRAPYAPFMENLAVGILPEHLWRKIPRETAILSDLNLKPVGTGPYKFKKFTRREDGTITSLTLVRNERFYLPGPYLKKINFSFYEDEEKLIAAYRRSEIDSFAFLSASRLEEISALDLELRELKPPKIFAVFLNSTAQPALGRPAVRKALAQSIDRAALIEKAADNGGVAVNSAIPPGAFGFADDIPPLQYNPEEARELLAKDGWKDADKNGVLERAEGRGRAAKTQKLEISIATSDSPELEETASFIAEAWKAVGVKTEVKIFALSDLEALMMRPRAYEALVFGEVFGHDPDPFAFWHTSQMKDPGLNIAMYSNRKADELLEEARRTNDAEAREQKYREFQKIVSGEIGAIFLYSPAHYYAVRKSIQGVAFQAVTLPEERFNGVNQWYIETRRTLK